MFATNNHLTFIIIGTLQQCKEAMDNDNTIETSSEDEEPPLKKQSGFPTLLYKLYLNHSRAVSI